MYYWPHYAQISPEARLAQLQWQSTGRRDPRFGIGHVFIFFYGLEHRVDGGEKVGHGSGGVVLLRGALKGSQWLA